MLKGVNLITNKDKQYDYSNKHSYDGVAPKENEALVPFLAHEVLANYQQDVKEGRRKTNDGIIESNFETCNIRVRKLLVGFVAISKSQAYEYVKKMQAYAKELYNKNYR